MENELRKLLWETLEEYELEEKKGREGDLQKMKRKMPGYFKGLSPSTANKRASQFKKQAKMSDSNPAAYKEAPGDSKGTKVVSKWTRMFDEKFNKKKNESKQVDQDKDGDNDFDDVKIARMKASGMSHDDAVEKVHETIERAEDTILDSQSLIEEIHAEEILEALNAKTRKALKNKAEKANAPMGALTTVYNKGLAAWKTGHRPGAGQHQWAMARVNSFLAGGPARRVDDAQWKSVQKHRKKNRKSKKKE